MTPLPHRQWLRPLLTSRLPTSRTLTSKSTAPPALLITPGSPHHNDLPSFLAYATRVSLAPTKTVYIGTHYEYTVARSLHRLGFDLLRTGRRADHGIDLLGHWRIPALGDAPLRVLAQCKARGAGVAPRHVRELEGAFQSVPAAWRRGEVLGLLVSTRRATRGVLEALGGNRWPMGFLKVSRAGVVEQFLWNRSAVEKGLEGVGVTVRYVGGRTKAEGALVGGDKDGRDEDRKGKEGKGKVEEKGLTGKKKRAAKEKEGGVRKDIQLTWMGRPIFPDREELDEKTVGLVEEIAGGEEVLSIKPKTKRESKPGSKKNTKEEPKKRGRPPGSRNKKPIATKEKAKTTPKVGRPKASENKKAITAIQNESHQAPKEKDRGTSLYLLDKDAESQIHLSIGS